MGALLTFVSGAKFGVRVKAKMESGQWEILYTRDLLGSPLPLPAYQQELVDYSWRDKPACVENGMFNQR